MPRREVRENVATDMPGEKFQTAEKGIRSTDSKESQADLRIMLGVLFQLLIEMGAVIVQSFPIYVRKRATKNFAETIQSTGRCPCMCVLFTRTYRAYFDC